jgi:integrase
MSMQNTPHPATQTRRLPPEILRPEEVRSLIGACDPGSWIGLRNRALIAVLYRSGLRIGETLALSGKDIDLGEGAIRVLWAKGGRTRTVGIDSWANGMLGEWLDRRSAMGYTPRQPVFVGQGGRGLTTGSCRRLLAALGREAGIDRRVHPHGLRHTHAAELRAEGFDIGIISRQLGHRSIATTARYLDHIAPHDVVAAIRART